MRYFCQTLLFITVVPTVWFSSCAKVEDYSDSKPIISEVIFNMNDTLHFDGLIIKINDSTNTKPNGIDTLVIGHTVFLKARFQDEIGLSSYKVEMNVDSSLMVENKDSVYRFFSLGIDIFSSNNNKISDITVMRNNLVAIPTYTTKLNKETSKTDTLSIYQGDYIMKVACTNIAGKRDSIYYKVKLLSRDSIYTIRTKK